MDQAGSLDRLLAQVRACRVCAADLPGGVRPIVQVGVGAPIVIIGQAPGRRVHLSGVPWSDASGVRLRAWLGLSQEEFYDRSLVALLPMGFCFPGSTTSGDRPPRPECAPLWHPRLLPYLASDRLNVIIGAYAQRRYLVERRATLTQTVAAWEQFLPDTVVLPHPSPRNQRWLSVNPWFETEAVPAVRRRVRQALRRPTPLEGEVAPVPMSIAPLTGNP
ncbi:MAG: uracil-DNA glycosylase family protein [Actinomycetota bacterium]|nr:uracil-DNA glycosylase family protein [Actinomycetota bacterium]